MPPESKTLNSLDACNPAFNATVAASAGSGKTWLLITRIVRLLIDGAEPGNIIALTFTRKAAGEMQMRLNERLFAMAVADEDELVEQLALIDCQNNTENRQIAASLYEKLMHSLYPVRIQTFHSFCQDILSRFPLEAGIAPGFELLEDSSLLERQALQTLFDEAKSSPDDKHRRRLNTALDGIMHFCNGPDNTQTSLRSFLSHRSDWWAYTANAKDPLPFAGNRLTDFLQIDPSFLDGNETPATQFFDESMKLDLMVFANLLREVKTATSIKHADIIDQALKFATNNNNNETRFSLIKSAFLIKSGDPMSQGRKHSAALEKKLGSENTDKFLGLHLDIAGKIQQTNEQIKRLLTLEINLAWYFSGHRYIEIYQQLKKEMRLLDFTDLEWKCYQLLQHADNAHWVQYKVDQRIEHILIDEFQDTNPTQWQLLSPILDEIAASPEQRQRSVFLVGDEKQSIYSFRRANPALQAQASLWLKDRLAAKAIPLDFSRRSSNAIIQCVNHIFEQADILAIMRGYTTHGTHLDKLPGKVQLCELFDADEETQETTDDSEIVFRNPLRQPRENNVKTLRHDEAEYISQQILQLINSTERITDNGCVRPIEFGDIMILMRNRTHLAIYEEALKQQSIPFIGNKKGGFLDNLEIQDLNCLLNLLITPYNNLALAQILKSPIFSASDEDLITLARFRSKQKQTHWYNRLLILSEEDQQQLSRPLQRAAHLLPHWQQLAEQLPVHDCLDKIFSEGNISKRYMATNKAENQQKVAANLQQLLNLSLETDSGRYPSITRFLQRLNHLQNHSSNPPEEPLPQSNASRVRLMTIHGSKGLEAPVIFLADCNSTASNKNAYSSLVQWPADKSQPVNFQLQLSKDYTDAITQQLQQEKLKAQQLEELNLLYVALTRAREQLYISGVASRSQSNSWYQIIANGLKNVTQSETSLNGTQVSIYRYSNYSQAIIDSSSKDAAASDNSKIEKEGDNTSNKQLDIRLLKPIGKITPSNFLIAPSLTADKNFKHDSDSDKHQKQDNNYQQDLAQWRGISIHRTIEQLCNSKNYPATEIDISQIRNQLTAETSLKHPAYITHIDECIREAVITYNHTNFEPLFNTDEHCQTYNEMPLMYKQKKQTVYGIVDRVIKHKQNITVIDYKSHQLSPGESAKDSALQFLPQMEYYRSGINKLWPQHEIKTGVLFTHHNEIVWLD